MERNNKFDELKAQIDRIKAEEDALNAQILQLEESAREAELERLRVKAQQQENELMEKEIAELKKQIEALEQKDAAEPQSTEVVAVKPVVPEKTHTVTSENLPTNVSTGENAIQSHDNSVAMQNLFAILSYICYAFAVVDFVLFFIFGIDVTGFYFSIVVASLLGSGFAVISNKFKKKRIDAIVDRLEKKKLDTRQEATNGETPKTEEKFLEKEIAMQSAQQEPEKNMQAAVEPSNEKVVEPLVVKEEAQTIAAKKETDKSVAADAAQPVKTEVENVAKEPVIQPKEETPAKDEGKTKGKNKKMWFILLPMLALIAVACVFLFKPSSSSGNGDFAGNDQVYEENPSFEHVSDAVATAIETSNAVADSLEIVAILDELNRSLNDYQYKCNLPFSAEYERLQTRADAITDSITRTTGAEWDDEWYDLVIPWMEPWADPNVVEYEILEYENWENGVDKRIEVTVDFNDPEYRGHLSTVTVVFVSEAGNWVIDNVASHKEILADFIERNTCTQIKNYLTFRVNGVEFNMVAVSGGSFIMGATSEQENAYNDEKPAHQVILNDYYIGETEVTQELWQAVMGTNPSHFNGSNLPVESVSYNDCVEFVGKLNELLSDDLVDGLCFSLPTEAEWEFAARGANLSSKSTQYSGGQNVDDVAWYDANSGGSTHLVKSKSPNELGIFDMSGNVYEWCKDWYSRDYYSVSPSNDPQGPADGTHRVIRGGSWDLQTKHCRVALRNYASPGAKGFSNGLRLALTVDANSVQNNTNPVHDEISEVIVQIEQGLNDGTEDRFLTQEFKSVIATAGELVTEKELYGEWIVCNYWTESQDYDTLTIKVLEYVIISDTKVLVKTEIINSSSWRDDYVMCSKDMTFVRLNDGWLIDDLSFGVSSSFREYTQAFIDSYK